MSPSKGFMMYSSAPSARASRMRSRSLSTEQNTTRGASPPGSATGWRSEFQSVHHRHLPVEKDDVGHRRAGPRQALGAVAGLGHLEAQVLENAARDLAHDPAVVDDEAELHVRGILEHALLSRRFG